MSYCFCKETQRGTAELEMHSPVLSVGKFFYISFFFSKWLQLI